MQGSFHFLKADNCILFIIQDFRWYIFVVILNVNTKYTGLYMKWDVVV